MDNFVGSNQGKAVIAVTIVAVIIATVKYSMPVGATVGLLLVTALIAFNATCLVKGGCNIWSWITVVTPLFLTVMLIIGMVAHNKDPSQPEEPKAPLAQ
jgi:Ca2+/Na+ antiporter